MIVFLSEESIESMYDQLSQYIRLNEVRLFYCQSASSGDLLCINSQGDRHTFRVQSEKCYFKVCAFFNPPKVIQATLSDDLQVQ